MGKQFDDESAGMHWYAKQLWNNGGYPLMMMTTTTVCLTGPKNRYQICRPDARRCPRDNQMRSLEKPESKTT